MLVMANVLAGWLSHRLTWVESFAPNLSHLASIMRLLVALERGSVGTEGALHVDHTTMIKSVRAYENKISIQFQSSIQKQRPFT